MKGLTIRSRGAEDLPFLVEIIARVHEQDRYPVLKPSGGFQHFITEPPSVASWVATDQDGALLGHVSLNAETSSPAMALVDSLDDLRSTLYVSRLFVDPSRRRSGTGQALLRHARDEAVSQGLLPALDVVDIATAAHAIALYRREGWTEIGTVSFDLAGLELTERVFVYEPDGGP